jgi:hypothetical protein
MASADEDARNMMKMLEISEALLTTDKSGGFDLMDRPAERQFVREGTLKKCSGTLGTKPRVVFLFTDVLLVTEEVGKKMARQYKIGRVLWLAGVRLRTHRHHAKSSKHNHFSIVALPNQLSGTQEQYSVELAAASPEERDEWLADIKRCVVQTLDSQGGGSELCDYARHHELVEGTLSHAAVRGDVARVHELLEACGDGSHTEFAQLCCAERDEFGASALAVATFAGQAKALEVMLRAESMGALVRRPPDGRGWGNREA